MNTMRQEGGDEAIRADLEQARREDHDWRDLRNLRASYFAGG